MALTGTPGTGKSTTARVLAQRHSTVEVGELARRLGYGRRAPEGVTVDLEPLVRKLRRDRSAIGSDLVVGHLAHLLPIRDVVVLRCHPRELERRLARAGRSSADDRKENVLAEAIGVITAEAVSRRRTVFEVDTTGKGPSRVAREVERWMNGPRPARWGRIDWLRDRTVTDRLLEWAA